MEDCCLMHLIMQEDLSELSSEQQKMAENLKVSIYVRQMAEIVRIPSEKHMAANTSLTPDILSHIFVILVLRIMKIM